MSDESTKLSLKTTTTDLAFPELTKVQLNESINQLVQVMPEHKQMLEVIQSGLPEIQRASSLFMKTQSQFMDNMMTVSHMTPLRNLRQILAQMTSTRAALREAHHKLKKQDLELEGKEIEIRQLERRLERKVIKSGGIKIGKITILGKDEGNDEELAFQREKDELKIRQLRAEAEEIVSGSEVTKGYISGAIRTLANYTAQYEEIRKAHGIEEFNEADFEAEEEKYHIMKAFEQALCAARTRHDKTIDEGNMIYLTQIGINGAHAQLRINEYLNGEQKLLQGRPANPELGIPAVEPRAPSHVDYVMFLERLYAEFKGSAERFAEMKGMTTKSNVALIQQGDTRLLLAQKDGSNLSDIDVPVTND